MNEHDTAHLQAEDLSARIDGELSPDRAAAVDRHLAGCAACRAEREALRQTAAFVRAMPRARLPRGASLRVPVEPSGPARRGWLGVAWPYLALGAAAGVAGLLALGLLAAGGAAGLSLPVQTALEPAAGSEMAAEAPAALRADDAPAPAGAPALEALADEEGHPAQLATAQSVTADRYVPPASEAGGAGDLAGRPGEAAAPAARGAGNDADGADDAVVGAADESEGATALSAQTERLPGLPGAATDAEPADAPSDASEEEPAGPPTEAPVRALALRPTGEPAAKDPVAEEPVAEEPAEDGTDQDAPADERGAAPTADAGPAAAPAAPPGATRPAPGGPPGWVPVAAGAAVLVALALLLVSGRRARRR